MPSLSRNQEARAIVEKVSQDVNTGLRKMRRLFQKQRREIASRSQIGFLLLGGNRYEVLSVERKAYAARFIPVLTVRRDSIAYTLSYLEDQEGGWLQDETSGERVFVNVTAHQMQRFLDVMITAPVAPL